MELLNKMYTQIRTYAGEKELLITCNIDYDGKSVSLSLSGGDKGANDRENNN